MSQFLTPFIQLLHQISGIMPLPVFTIIGSFVEEIIAPIPSPLVMTLAGSLAAAQGAPLFYLLVLALAGAIAKTVGAYIIYFFADKLEDVFLVRFGKFIGVTHREIEALGKKLNQGSRDDVAIFLLRAIPIIPTAPVSIVCGLVKINLRAYILGTLGGTFVRNIFYLYLGFTSVGALESINGNLDSLKTIGYVIVLLIVASIFGLLLWLKRRHKHQDSQTS